MMLRKIGVRSEITLSYRIIIVIIITITINVSHVA